MALPTISDAESMPARKLEDADYMARKVCTAQLKGNKWDGSI